MLNYARSRTFWLVFLASLVAVVMTAIGVFLYTWQADMAHDVALTQRENALAVTAITDYVDGLFRNAAVQVAQLQSTEWVLKLCVQSPVFDGAFDYVRRREIAADFLFHAGGNVITRRFLIYPYKDIAIGERVWTDVSSYLGIIGVPVPKRAGLSEAMREVSRPSVVAGDCASGHLLICMPVEAISRSRVIFCFFIDVSGLQNSIGRMMPAGLVGMRIACAKDGAVLAQQGECMQTGGVTVETVSARYIDWQYEFFINPNVAMVRYTQEQRHPYAYVLMAALLCMAIAYALAIALYRPVAKLMMRAGLRRAKRQRGMGDFRMIGEHLELMTELYSQNRRQVVLQRLLSGYFKQDQALLAELHIPFANSAQYKVFLCAEREGAPKSDVERAEICAELDGFLRERRIWFGTLVTIDADLILIVSFPNEAMAQQFPSYAISKLLSERYAVFAGPLSHGLIGISISYQSAREKHAYLSGLKPPKYYFPLDWENQLLDALLSGKPRVAEGICLAVRLENERRLARGHMTDADCYCLFGALAGLLKRAMDEASCPEAKELENFNDLFAKEATDEIWDGINIACAEICAQLSPETGGEDNGQRIVRYIDGHYDDHDLSLTAMEGVFGISANTVNKSIKQVRGMTFHAYLTKRRIERAKELLLTGTYRISEIAQLVGYDTEYSFRRAFQRHTGVKAHEYNVDA